MSSLAIMKRIFLRMGQGDLNEYSQYNRTLGKVIAFSGSSSGDYRSNNPNIIRTIQEREAILRTKINVAFLGWKRLNDIIPNELFDLGDNPIALGLKLFLPAMKAFYHTSMWVSDADANDLNSNSQGICIEYGAYSKGDSTHQNVVHYFKKDGMRFSRMSLRYYRENYVKGKEETYRNSIPTSVKNKMTVNQLCDAAFIRSSFDAEEYEFTSHNCQFFIATCIKILGLRRRSNAFSRSHNLSKLVIPFRILGALEKEEDDARFFRLKEPDFEGLVRQSSGSVPRRASLPEALLGEGSKLIIKAMSAIPFFGCNERTRNARVRDSSDNYLQRKRKRITE